MPHSDIADGYCMRKKAELRPKSVSDSCSVVEIYAEQQPYSEQEQCHLITVPALCELSRELNVFVALKLGQGSLKLMFAAHIGIALFNGRWLI